MSVDTVSARSSMLDDDKVDVNKDVLEVEREALKVSGCKKLLQKNVMEGLVCANKKKNIDTESKNVQISINKEERMLRGQLERLQEEQRTTAEEEDDLSVITDMTLDMGYEEDIVFDDMNNDDVINPYPVTIQSHRPPSARIILHDKSRSIHDLFRRKSSSRISCLEYEDLDSQQRVESGLRRLYRCDTLSQGAPITKEEEYWAGEPAAINSIRRPLKPNSLHTKVLSCSKSWKENQINSHDSLSASFGNMELSSSIKHQSPKNSIHGIQRHQSLKECKISDESRQQMSALHRSRHLSLKERKRSYDERGKLWIANETPPNSPKGSGSPPQGILHRRRVMPLHLRPISSKYNPDSGSATPSPVSPLSPASGGEGGHGTVQSTATSRKHSKKNIFSSTTVVHRRWCSQ